MNNLRIAWLLTVAPFYWHPLLSELRQLFPQLTLFTGGWPGFAQGYENSFKVEVVGERKVITLARIPMGYDASFMYLSPRIVGYLLRFCPDVIFADGFCIWTVLALFLKQFTKWKIVIIYDGSSPTVDDRKSQIRLLFRRRLAQTVDAFITNNQGGKDYLINVIRAKKDVVFAEPYLVPDVKALLQQSENTNLIKSQLPHPIFLFVGQIIPRKGLHNLLEACSILKKQGYLHYTLLIVGDGLQRKELETYIKTHNLEANVKWIGKVEYSRLGAYFEKADIFVFPTFEDVWGMVVPEAMSFGKPILCSNRAGAAELIIEGENGYCFEPHNSENIAQLMSRFINNSELAVSMGSKSKQMMTQYTPKNAAECIAQVTSFIMKN